MKNLIIIAFVGIALLACEGIAGTTYDDGNIVIDSSNIYSKTDDALALGKSGNEFSQGHFTAITLGGTSKTSWGSVVSPITDASGYVNPTDAGNYVRLYDAGTIRLGDATNAGDYYTLYSSDAGSWYAGHDDTSNVYVVGYGTSVGTDVRLKIKFDANTSEVTLGDGTAGYDKYLRFEGASTADYYIGIDDTGGDSDDVFVIGTGSAVGTGVAMSIDTSGVVAVTAGLDAIGAADMDYGSADVTDHTFTTDSTGDAEIVLPNDSIGDAEIDWSGLTTSHGLVIGGTTPILTVGDGGAEDNTTYYNGTVDFTTGVDYSSETYRITNGADMDATVAISISTAEDVTLPAGSLYIIDDEFVVLGTDSDFTVQYDEGVDDQVIFLTTTTGAGATTDPLYEFLVPATPTADQQVFGVAKGTQASNTPLITLDEDGDLIVAGTSTLTGNVTLTGDIDIDGGDITCPADLKIDPTGTEVHIDGGLAVGDTTAVGDNNLKVVGTSALVGKVTVTAALEANGTIILDNDEVVANAGDGVVTVTSDDVTGCTVTIIGGDHNTTSDASLILDADAGGDAADTWTIISEADGNDLSILNAATEVMNLTSSGALQIDGSITMSGGQTRSVIYTPNDVTLDGTVNPGTTDIGTTAQARFDTLGFDSDTGATGDDWVFINWVVPAGYITDSGDLNVYWSYSTAEDAGDEITIDGTVNAIGAGEAIDAAGTGMAAVASVITDASTGEGKIYKTSLDIEVEDIVVGDLVCIGFFVDESASLMANSGTADVHYFEITYESTE